jgi:hypothetical protein
MLPLHRLRAAHLLSPLMALRNLVDFRLPTHVVISSVTMQL